MPTGWPTAAAPGAVRKLAPDTPMREEALSHEHGLSRHTVRRALERLVAQRLLVSRAVPGCASDLVRGR
ncbi:GntR family transcriptional regulator [Aeromicrobium sp. UC242_57]|uniref:GntR family transcriptional regulator n=1 Tax=Aeromicrobium sp. UC242_57 TaxID=3374624 RepID=UPI0037B18922